MSKRCTIAIVIGLAISAILPAESLGPALQLRDYLRSTLPAYKPARTATSTVDLVGFIMNGQLPNGGVDAVVVSIAGLLVVATPSSMAFVDGKDAALFGAGMAAPAAVSVAGAIVELIPYSYEATDGT